MRWHGLLELHLVGLVRGRHDLLMMGCRVLEDRLVKKVDVMLCRLNCDVPSDKIAVSGVTKERSERES